MQRRYNVGDVVYIRPGTEYMSQSDGKSGVIQTANLPDKDDHLTDDEYYYNVRWENGDTNAYRNKDLISEKDYRPSVSDHHLSKSDIIHEMKKRYGKISLSDRFISVFGCDGLVKTTNPMEWTYSSGSFEVSLFLAESGCGGCRIYNYRKETGIEEWATRANLPDKWQVFGDTYTSDGKKVAQWRAKHTEYDSYSGQGYIDENGYFRSQPDYERAIITHDEFMKWVYDPKSKESTSELWIAPGKQKVWKIIANRDIYPHDIVCSGSMPFIPKGTILWIHETNQLDNIIHQSGNVHPFDNKWSANIPAKYFDIHHDNPYSEEESKSSPKFKEGDTVKAIDQSHGWSSVDYGDIGKVKEYCGIANGKHQYLVDFPDHHSWTGEEHCFELVEKYIISVDPYTDESKEHPYIKDVESINLTVVKPKKSNRLTI